MMLESIFELLVAEADRRSSAALSVTASGFIAASAAAALAAAAHEDFSEYFLV